MRVLHGQSSVLQFLELVGLKALHAFSSQDVDIHDSRHEVLGSIPSQASQVGI